MHCPPSIPFHFYSQPLFTAVFPAQMAAADGGVSVCVCSCTCLCVSTLWGPIQINCSVVCTLAPNDKKWTRACTHACVHECVVYTQILQQMQTHTDIHTFKHQWGNPCLSVSPVLSVLLCLCSHCNSVWSWLLLCHSHILACVVTNTQTLQLCEIHCKANPWWGNYFSSL